MKTFSRLKLKRVFHSAVLSLVFGLTASNAFAEKIVILDLLTTLPRNTTKEHDNNRVCNAVDRYCGSDQCAQGNCRDGEARSLKVMKDLETGLYSLEGVLWVKSDHTWGTFHVYTDDVTIQFNLPLTRKGNNWESPGNVNVTLKGENSKLKLSKVQPHKVFEIIQRYLPTQDSEDLAVATHLSQKVAQADARKLDTKSGDYKAPPAGANDVKIDIKTSAAAAAGAQANDKDLATALALSLSHPQPNRIAGSAGSRPYGDAQGLGGSKHSGSTIPSGNAAGSAPSDDGLTEAQQYDIAREIAEAVLHEDPLSTDSLPAKPPTQK